MVKVKVKDSRKLIKCLRRVKDDAQGVAAKLLVKELLKGRD